MGIQINGATDSITAIDGTIDVVSAIGNAGVVTATAFVGNITGNVTGNINNASALELQTGGVTRGKFDSSGRMLLNTTTEGHNNADDLTIATTDHTGITLRSATNRNGSVFFSDGTSGADEYRGWIQYTHTSDYLTFGTNATEKLRITSSGVLKLTGQSTSFETAGLTHHTNNNLYIRGGTTGAILQSVDGNEAWIVQNDYVSASTSGSERLRITSTGDVAINRTSALNTAKFSLTKDADQQAIGVQLNQSSGITTSLAAYNSSGTNIFDLAHDTDSTPDLLFKLKHSSDAAPVEKLRIASNGDIGLGTVPETDSFQPSLYFAGGNANIWGSGNANLYTAVNARYTGGGGWKYNNNGLASYTAQQSGTWEFRNAPSGTADNVATFTTRLQIATDGDLTHTGADNVEYKMKCGSSSGNNIIAFLNSSGTTRGNITYDSDNNFLFFNVNQGERLRITSGGRVGINTTTDSMAGVTGNLNIANTNFNNHTVINLSRNTTSDRPHIRFQDPNGNVGYIGTYDSDLTVSSSNDLILRANSTDKLRITNAGAFGLAGANYGSSGQVLTSQGSSSAPVWANAGITMADQWRLTSSFTLPGSVSIINSNWGRVASPAGYGNLGSAMSESSGAFTFPATGIYYIEFTILISMTQSARYVGNRIQTSTDNFSSANTVAETLGHMALANSFGAYHTSSASLIFDVTNTSTHKIRFCGVSINPSASSVIGNANQNSTFVTFIRLGDT